MKRVLLTLGVLATLTVPSPGYILVEDIPQLVAHTYSQAVNYVQYVNQTLQQVQAVINSYTSLENEYTMIVNQYDQLRRFGNPSYYINVLNLNGFRASGSNLAQGVGQTLSQIQSAANGVEALGYTANGMYADLSRSVDRFGQPVNYATDAFRKFDAVNRAGAAYDRQIGTYNQQIATLERQHEQAIAQANSDSSSEGRARYQMLAEGIRGQMDGLHAQMAITGQRVQQLQVQNQNDASRTQEAARQQLEQERDEDLRRSTSGWADFLGGSN